MENIQEIGVSNFQSIVYLGDWQIKMFEPRPNLVLLYLSTQELLTPNFRVFGETLIKTTPKTNLQTGA